MADCTASQSSRLLPHSNTTTAMWGSENDTATLRLRGAPWLVTPHSGWLARRVASDRFCPPHVATQRIMQRILSLLHHQSLTTALRSVSTPVDRSHIDTRTFRRLCADLKASMRVEGGVGLAAPQCGELLRVFVMRVQPPHRRLMRSARSTLSHAQQKSLVPLADEASLSEKEWDERLEADEEEVERMESDELYERSEADERGHPSSPMVIINPVILAVSPQSSIRQEACLSIPGYTPRACFTLHSDAEPVMSTLSCRSVCAAEVLWAELCVLRASTFDTWTSGMWSGK